MTRALGTFDVRLSLQGAPDSADGIALARLTLDKVFQGDLAGTSKGEMLSSSTDANGSKAYVAMERVTGTLGGKSGSFVLMHSGTMTNAGMQLTVNVAAQSGTGDLATIAGALKIIIENGKHSYHFDYTLDDAT